MSSEMETTKWTQVPIAERRALAEMYRLGMLNAANCAEQMGAADVAKAIRDLADGGNQSVVVSPPETNLS